MKEFEALHALVKTDPEAAWPHVIGFLRQHPERGEAQDLIEDFVYEHDDRFIGLIEAAALADANVRSVVEQAYVSGFATRGAEEFHRLQDKLRRLNAPDP